MKKKQIVFYCSSTPTLMVHRIASEFRKKGYQTVLFTMCGKDRFDGVFYEKAFDNVFCSDFQFFKPSLNTIFYSIKQIPHFLYFLFNLIFSRPYAVMGIAGNNWQLKLIHKYLFKKTPFIYFPYDILSTMLEAGNPPKFEIEAERYCFENADGIIHKGDPDELKPFEKRMKLSKSQLSFLPYCSEESIIPINKNKLSKKDGKIHLVYMGFFYNDPLSVKKFIECFKTILKQQIHIHIYTKVSHIPLEQEERYIRDFFAPVIDNKYFHLHKLIGKKETIQEISKYDFGFWPIHAITQESKIATGNKLAGFLEAGLPFIYDENLLFVDKLVKGWGMKNLSFNNTNLKKLKKRLNNINYDQLLSNLEKARKEFNFNNYFSRLNYFIDNIISEKKSLKKDSIY